MRQVAIRDVRSIGFDLVSVPTPMKPFRATVPSIISADRTLVLQLPSSDTLREV